jgi:hypothetical protein
MRSRTNHVALAASISQNQLCSEQGEEEATQRSWACSSEQRDKRDREKGTGRSPGWTSREHRVKKNCGARRRTTKTIRANEVQNRVSAGNHEMKSQSGGSRDEHTRTEQQNQHRQNDSPQQQWQKLKVGRQGSS